MSQFTVAALLFLTVVLPSCAEDKSKMRTLLVNLDDHTKLIQEQASVIADNKVAMESLKNTTKFLDKTIQDMEAEMNAMKADMEGKWEKGTAICPDALVMYEIWKF